MLAELGEWVFEEDGDLGMGGGAGGGAMIVAAGEEEDGEEG